MKNVIALVLMAFIAFGGLSARADEKAVAPQPAAQMTDDELVSYINGRLNADLTAEGYKVSRACTAQNGCDVIVERTR